MEDLRNRQPGILVKTSLQDVLTKIPGSCGGKGTRHKYVAGIEVTLEEGGVEASFSVKASDSPTRESIGTGTRFVCGEGN